MAILKAGGAFTCIDPLFPDAQVRTILEDARPAVVLTDEAGLMRLGDLPARHPVMDVVEWAAQWRGDGAPPSDPAWLSPDSLAYLIYTSGTTGMPKGVMIEHRSIVSLVRGDLETLGVKPGDRGYAGCPTRPVDDRLAQVDRPAELVAAGGADGVHSDGARRRSPRL